MNGITLLRNAGLVACLTSVLLISSCVQKSGPITTFLYAPIPNNNQLSDPAVDLKIDWSVDASCSDRKLLSATVRLHVSGGVQPYEYTPPPESSSLRAGQAVHIVIRSKDDQIWIAEMEAPSNCFQASEDQIFESVLSIDQFSIPRPTSTITADGP